MKYVWWAHQDLNLGPHDYQSSALASWAMGPYQIKYVLINIAIKIIYNLYKLDNKKSFECLRLQLN
jgi:hypothetical protein